MTKQHTPEQEFDEFMSGKTELSRLYQQLDSNGPSEFTDKQIMSAARRAAKAHRQGAGTNGIRWYIPVAIAASLALLTVLAVFHFQSDVQAPSDIAEHGTQEREINSNLKHDPARLLAVIVQLQKDGKSKQANDQFIAFKQLYPDFIIDFEKYPELKSLEKTD